ncbi:MAG TPA: hypothetical protein VIU42_16005 [Xanthobacteraceae bacterium]|jgi:hypothetical protein
MKPLQIPQEETCPVSEQLLGELYRASAHGLESLIETVPANTRAMLALYCHRRSHLQSIALAVAATCEERHLEEFGGYAGKVLFEKARKAPEKPHLSHFSERKQVSLSRGAIMQVVIDQDLI